LDDYMVGERDVEQAALEHGVADDVVVPGELALA
jgi:hypothetical protein